MPGNRRGVYSGSFNPPTRAHLAIAEAARVQHNLDRVDLVVSRQPIGKEGVVSPPLPERLDVIRASTAAYGWLHVRVTDDRLIVDISVGYDVVIMGADKWQQIHDLAHYESVAQRDAAVTALAPRCVVAPRGGVDLPAAVTLDLAPEMQSVSSSSARAGRYEWMTPEALASGLWSSGPGEELT